MFCCAASGGIADSCYSGVVLVVRANVDGFVLPESATDCTLFQERLQRGSGIAQSDLHENEPHPYGGVGSTLPGYAHLDLLHHANGRSKLCWRNQFRSSRVDGGVHRMVSEVVSTAHCAWIDDRVKELGKEGFDPWCVVRAQVICSVGLSKRGR